MAAVSPSWAAKVVKAVEAAASVAPWSPATICAAMTSGITAVKLISAPFLLDRIPLVR
jgi:2-keto-3-deoxy-6-phosphogluconate aldolase